MMVPSALAVAMVAPTGLFMVMLNLSSASKLLSLFTSTMIVLLVSPAANVTVPDGNKPPTKSSPVAWAPPTAQSAVLLPDVPPLRFTVNV